MRRLLCLLLLAACGKKGAVPAPGGNDDASKICQDAKARYEACIAETLGKSAVEQLAPAAQCVADPATVATYRKCLPAGDCKSYLDCVEGVVTAGPAQPARADDRAARCATGFKDAERNLAQLVTDNLEGSSQAEKDQAQKCLLDTSNPVDGCLGPAARREFDGYLEQRRLDCLRGPAEVASCMLDDHCDGKTVWPWRGLLAGGPAGPRVLHELRLSDPGGSDEPMIRWTRSGVLILADGSQVRGVEGGKDLWNEPQNMRAWVAGDVVLVPPPVGQPGLRLLDGRTGKPVGTIDNDELVAGVGDGDPGRVLVLFRDGRLVEVDGSGKLRTVATLSDDEAMREAVVTWLGDGRVILDSEGERMVLKGGKRAPHGLMLDESVQSFAAGPGQLAIRDTTGYALLSADGCLQGKRITFVRAAAVLDPAVELKRSLPSSCEQCIPADASCIVAWRRAPLALLSRPHGLPGGGLVINQGDGTVIKADEDVGRTTLLAPGASWTVRTGGIGEPDGDERAVYTVVDDGFERRLLALDRRDGHALWQTVLEGVDRTATGSDVAVVAGPTQLAVRVGAKILVLPKQP